MVTMTLISLTSNLKQEKNTLLHSSPLGHHWGSRTDKYEGKMQEVIDSSYCRLAGTKFHTEHPNPNNDH